MIYFTSDIHFGHEKIIKHCKRPFNDVESMNNRIINNWNKIINYDDEVYILGDLTMKGAAYANEYLQKLTGKKYFISGNHDRFIYNKDFNNNLFVFIKNYYELEYKNIKFILFHYPIHEWNGYYKNTIHLHGHIHTNNIDKFQLKHGNIYDVGVDANNFTPISIEDIISKFS